MPSGFNAPTAIHHTLSHITREQSCQTLVIQNLIQDLIADAYAKAYNYICIPLTNQNWQIRWREMCIKDGKGTEKHILPEQRAELWRDGPSFRREEITLTRIGESQNVIGMVSEWLELDSPNDRIRFDSEMALLQELSYASYLNVQTVILPPPRNRSQVGSYARSVNAALAGSGSFTMHISIRMPICHPVVSNPLLGSSIMQSDNRTTESLIKAPDADFATTWEMWDVIRTICAYNPRLSLTLDLTPPLPPNSRLFARWTAEPTRYLFLPAAAFLTNPKGYPVLSKATQAFVREIISQRPTIIFSGTESSLHRSGGEGAYQQYVRHLEKTSPGVLAAETEGTVENFARGYQDYLQAPLQPLMDNLQSITYETFEKDPVKYAQYEKAVYLSLCDRPAGSRTVICVVGAGRGPLPSGCLRAAEDSRRTVQIYAIEKNPNAFVTLQYRKETEWGERVELVYGDMRTVELPEKVDILVSELLGSFGDNELSPECLDGAERFLKPGGISIPSSYAAYLTPLSSSKLFMEVSSGSREDKMAETPYVVMFQAVNILSGDGGGPRNRCGNQVQQCWEFEHPRIDPVLDARGLPTTNSHNVRSAHLNFYIPHAGVLHGLAGYFEAILYNDVCLSIHPGRKERISPNMLSWFPLFFPFKEPLYLPKNSELHVSIWRMTDKRKVWYEWYAESFLSVSPESQSSILSKSSPTQMANNLPVGTEDARSLLSPSPQGTPLPAGSPMLDAHQSQGEKTFTVTTEIAPEIIKIGQTSLHNPGGRSSWIGL